MNVSRISIALTSNGTGDLDPLYINPTLVDFHEEPLEHSVSVLDGKPVIQVPLVDNRLYSMTWNNYRKDLSTFANQLSILESYEKTTKWIKDPVTNRFANYTQIWIDKIVKKIQGGAGPIVYSTVTLYFYVTDANWTL